MDKENLNQKKEADVAYLIEDISTYKFLNTSDVSELLSKAYEKLGGNE